MKIMQSVIFLTLYTNLFPVKDKEDVIARINQLIGQKTRSLITRSLELDRRIEDLQKENQLLGSQDNALQEEGQRLTLYMKHIQEGCLLDILTMRLELDRIEEEQRIMKMKMKIKIDKFFFFLNSFTFQIKKSKK
jgi:hypothetical protein